MRRRVALAFALALALAACSPPRGAPRGRAAEDAPRLVASRAPTSAAPSIVASPEAPPPAPSQRDADGNDDRPVDDAPRPIEHSLAFRRVGRPPLALTRICDLTAFGGAIYAAHAHSPLGTDGATITRFDPDAREGAPRFTVAFDWNRPGRPTKGGGAGQGFLRVRALEGRLYVADADPPYAGFGLADHGTEGFVFASDERGRFAKARGEELLPPRAPRDGGAGASVLPRAYHVLDVVRFRGALYASTGSVPPGEPPWRGASPGALHVATGDRARFTYALSFPPPRGAPPRWPSGVWRLTYLTRFRDRLYAGIQDYDGRSPWDYVVFAPERERDTLRDDDSEPVRVTDDGAAHTLRWFAHGGALYWIAWGRDGVRLRVTRDGSTWSTLTFPEGSGAPTDVTVWRGAVVALTERGLFRIDGDRVVTRLAEVPRVKGRGPFDVSDVFCAAPLVAVSGRLFAGGQRSGDLWEVAAAEP